MLQLLYALIRDHGGEDRESLRSLLNQLVADSRAWERMQHLADNESFREFVAPRRQLEAAVWLARLGGEDELPGDL